MLDPHGSKPPPRIKYVSNAKIKSTVYVSPTKTKRIIKTQLVQCPDEHQCPRCLMQAKQKARARKLIDASQVVSFIPKTMFSPSKLNLQKINSAPKVDSNSIPIVLSTLKLTAKVVTPLPVIIPPSVSEDDIIAFFDFEKSFETKSNILEGFFTPINVTESDIAAFFDLDDSESNSQITKRNSSVLEASSSPDAPCRQSPEVSSPLNTSFESGSSSPIRLKSRITPLSKKVKFNLKKRLFSPSKEDKHTIDFYFRTVS